MSYAEEISSSWTNNVAYHSLSLSPVRLEQVRDVVLRHGQAGQINGRLILRSSSIRQKLGINNKQSRSLNDKSPINLRLSASPYLSLYLSTQQAAHASSRTEPILSSTPFTWRRVFHPSRVRLRFLIPPSWNFTMPRHYDEVVGDDPARFTSRNASRQSR